MQREKQCLAAHASALWNSDIGNRARVTKLFAEPSLESASEFFGIAF
jgi:hypothetical protein